MAKCRTIRLRRFLFNKAIFINRNRTEANAVVTELTNCTYEALNGCSEIQANDTWLSYSVVLQSGLMLFSTCPQGK